MCGEETSTANLAAMRERIPPRVRGRDPLDQAEGLDLGNTPACAGKSWSSFKKLPRVGNTPACAGKRATSFLPFSKLWKYPRVCGEEAPSAQQRAPKQEIPPRVRGRVDSLTVVLGWLGNTPACAGKRAFLTIQPFGYRKYPRVCGEETIIGATIKTRKEIPPRVRGRAVTGRAGIFADGNTPACAGKRRSSK